jgi:CBS domain-containing protein
MARLRDLPLVDAWIPESSTIAEAVARLFEARVPAIAVLDGQRRVVGVVAETDLLRAVFPRYLGDLRHTAFLADDSELLDERAKAVRSEPTKTFARVVAALDANESETHAAERFLHTAEQALPVVDGERFVGMLSIAALCDARLGRRDDLEQRLYS